MNKEYFVIYLPTDYSNGALGNNGEPFKTVAGATAYAKNGAAKHKRATAVLQVISKVKVKTVVEVVAK